MDYQYLLFAHLLGLALFLIGHGVSMFFTQALRRERQPDRLRAILDLSLSGLGLNYLGLVLLIGSGIWMGVAGGFFAQGWIWTAIAVLLVVMATMIYLGVTFFSPLRVAVGLQPYRQTGQVTLGPVASPEELNRLLSGRQPGIATGVGIVGLLALLVLMVFKPF